MESATAKKLRVVAVRGPRIGCAWSPKPGRRFVNLVRLLARQAAPDFVQAETDSQTRDRVPE
ncbi:hypothetical protein X736_32605 [Mesorhizobium sp. L2C089B000]|nr:hypothetical protein X736_32605 [Mesorhizobium sp. L2C089B000]